MCAFVLVCVCVFDIICYFSFSFTSITFEVGCQIHCNRMQVSVGELKSAILDKVLFFFPNPINPLPGLRLSNLD